MRKLLKFSVGTAFLLGLIPIVYTGLKIELFQRSITSLKIDLDEYMSSSVQTQSTIELNDGFSVPRRAYIDLKTGLIFTNYHVLQPFCESKGGGLCRGKKVIIKQVSAPDSPHTRLIQQSLCAEWLDLCVMKSEGWNEFTSDLKPLPISSPNILTLARDDKESKVYALPGNILKKNSVVSILELPTRKGQSGSPVFDKDANFLGLATANAQDLNVIDYAAFRAVWARRMGLYSPLTLVVNQHALDQIARCLDVESAECVRIQQDLLIELAQDYVAIQNDQNLSWVNKLSFRRQFVGQALQQIRDFRLPLSQESACSGDIRARKLEAAIRLMEHLSENQRNEKSLVEFLHIQQKCSDESQEYFQLMIKSLKR